MSERKDINRLFRDKLEQKSAVDELDGTPPERHVTRTFGYKHRTPPEWRRL